MCPQSTISRHHVESLNAQTIERSGATQHDAYFWSTHFPHVSGQKNDKDLPFHFFLHRFFVLRFPTHWQLRFLRFLNRSSSLSEQEESTRVHFQLAMGKTFVPLGSNRMLLLGTVATVIC
mmetsp:Transcript_14509/g.40351  ORF Transcript_14509/g.40351 Transcript_14509/m.40351 type:complete len:120 (-) Transcript_14509:699-1058(-)